MAPYCGQVGNAVDRLVSSALLDVRFSNGREGQDVSNVVFSFFYEVYIVMEDSKPFSIVHWQCNIPYGNQFSNIHNTSSTVYRKTVHRPSSKYTRQQYKYSYTLRDYYLPILKPDSNLIM